ncbi:MAG TPA: RluA family pseudouridine synthase [Candidatus Eisenbacteria bacterium]|nr:RluA family pseudouridine synthase [Candidatus Eisenbacteria bacterium]
MSVRTHAVHVTAAHEGERLDRVVATLAEVGTRSQAKQLVDGGHVRVDGVVRKASFVVRAGMRIEVDLNVAPPAGIEPEALPLRVLYEDAVLLAIDKPPGMVVHPAPGARRGTVVNALLHHLGALEGVGAAERPGIVHRLDKDTSGVLVVARTAAALEALARQFRARTIHKRYLALVHGHVRAASGTIDRPIGRDPRERKRMSVRAPRGRAAVTRYTVVERFPGATLLAVAPQTGRTHQIRVHLAALGHPIVGDAVYGGRRRGTARETADALAACPRQALHAQAITFVHPASGTEVHLEAPLPADLSGVLDTLRKLARTLKNPSLKT